MRSKFPKNVGALRLGLTVLLVVIIVIIVILVAGIGIYIAFGTGSHSISTNSTTASTAHSSSHSTSSTTLATTSFSSRSSTTLSGVSTYSGNFNYSLALGPSGERLSSNNTVETYSSVINASGSFTFSISSLNKSGTGSGHGTLIVTTTGFCSGSVSFPYTFQIPDATTLLGNLTLFVGNPTPSTFMVPLSCTGSMSGVNTSTNNPGSFLAVYPNELSAASLPESVTQTPSSGISYSYTIIQIS